MAIENPQDIIAISARPYGQRAVLKFANYTGAKSTVGRHTPGALLLLSCVLMSLVLLHGWAAPLTTLSCMMAVEGSRAEGCIWRAGATSEACQASASSQQQ